MTAPSDIEALRARLENTRGREYWRSLEALAETAEFKEFLHREFPHNASEWLDPVGRRSFLKASGGATALGLTGGGVSGDASATTLTKALRDSMTPDQIIAKMKEGNQRFRNGVRRNRDYLVEQRAGAAGQYPAAVLLTCIDSRAPAEVIMDLGLGAIFNSRIAGNH